MTRSRSSILWGLFCLAFVLVYCNREGETSSSEAVYRNLSGGADYVGMSACIACHANVYGSFRQTGMGRSFDHATPEKSGATFGEHAMVYDSVSDFYYQPYFHKDSLYIREFRLEGGDTVHRRIERVEFIVGSGQHTNSHLLSINGYVYQAPITFYTQDRKWDMAPGFQKRNERFSRLLTSECLTCHNHFPKLVQGSINKFEEMPRGIECERCHGPGSLHVQEKTAGILIDTAREVDYTIVNPRDLPRDRQMDLCQRCHLQGVAVLEDGKSFYDFMPGMELSEVLNVFLPRFSNSHEKFIMASQADRLRMSPCYQNSESLSCLSCHHPHHSVESTPLSKYNRSCTSCHGAAAQTNCTEAMAVRQAESDNCVGCHMPSSGSIDIPHVHITDHFISRRTVKRATKVDSISKQEIASFLGLQMMTKEDPSALDMARGYIATFDKYMEAPLMLDSAQYYLQQASPSEAGWFKANIHYHFARKAFDRIRQLAAGKRGAEIEDAWTAYRIGEAFSKEGAYQKALDFLLRATQLLPYHLEFQEKLGNAYVGLEQLQEAERTYRFVLDENPKRQTALCNLGYVRALQGQFREALQLYDRAVALDPDYVQALLNKAALMKFIQRPEAAKQLLERVLRIDPDNEQARNRLKSPPGI